MNQSKKIEKCNVGWSDSVVMVCTSCGEQFKSPDEQNAPERIKKALKSIIKDKLEKGSVRVITTSCLNICPVDKIAIVKASSNESEAYKGYVVEPDISGEELYLGILV